MDYPWLTDDQARTLRPRSQFEFEGEFSRNNVVGGVVVQALNDVRETATLLKLAQVNPHIFGVVGWLDLTSSSIDDDLARIIGGPGGEKLVGIRHHILDETDPSERLLPNLVRSLEYVAAAGLTFDLVIHRREIPFARELAAALPRLTFIVDHLEARSRCGEYDSVARRSRFIGSVPKCILQALGPSDRGPSIGTVDPQPT